MLDYTLVKKAEELHGHICPFLILGLRASEIAMQRLGVRKAGVEETIGEEILAIIECNNCFADGVQVATGCTLGNNSLVYLDVGKNAVTLVRRGEWKGVRVYVDSEKIRERYFGVYGKIVLEEQAGRKIGMDF
ncbi:MAG: FmdE family protein, partial [Candidatus Bathyarchaeia archaeon]